MPKKILNGVVVSDKPNKTITVLVERKYQHPVLKKVMKARKKYNAHDEQNEFKIGDKVTIRESKPYSKNKRLKLGKSYSDLCKLISKQKVNVVFTTVGLFSELFSYNRKNLTNYTEIYIKTNINKLKKNKSKIFYKVKTNNVWGLDIKPEYPKKPDILIENNFNKTSTKLAKIIFERIKKLEK